MIDSPKIVKDKYVLQSWQRSKTQRFKVAIQIWWWYDGRQTILRRTQIKLAWMMIKSRSDRGSFFW